MAYDKLVDSAALDALFSGIGDAIRSKTGNADLIDVKNMASEIQNITVSGEGSISADYYRCETVDESSRTWSGFKLIPMEGEIEYEGTNYTVTYYGMDENITTGLEYNINTPQIGHYYDSDADTEISGFLLKELMDSILGGEPVLPELVEIVGHKEDDVFVTFEAYQGWFGLKVKDPRGVLEEYGLSLHGFLFGSFIIDGRLKKETAETVEFTLVATGRSGSYLIPVKLTAYPARVIVAPDTVLIETKAGESISEKITAYSPSVLETLTFSSTDAPEGISVNSDGTITGSIITASVYSFTITISSSNPERKPVTTTVVINVAVNVAFTFSGSSNSAVNGDFVQTPETAGQTGQNASYTNGNVYVWYASSFNCWFCTTVLGDATSGPPLHASNGSGDDPWSVPDGWNGVTCTKGGSGGGGGNGGSSDIPENGFVVTGVTSPSTLNGTYSLTSGDISNLSSCQWTNANGGHLKYFSGGYWIFGDSSNPANTPGDCFYYGQGMDKKPWEITSWGDGSYSHSGTLVLTGAGSSSGGGDYTTFTVDGIRSYGELNGTYNRTSGSGKSAVYTISGGGTCSYHEGLSQWQFISTSGSVAIAATADAENPWDVERWWDDNMMNEPTITFSNMS